jgi:hypothetical protein
LQKRNKYNCENLLSDLWLNQPENYWFFFKNKRVMLLWTFNFSYSINKKTKYNNERIDFSQPKTFLDSALLSHW